MSFRPFNRQPPRRITHTDHLYGGARHAVALFLSGLVLVTAGAALGLNAWPGQGLLFVQSPSFENFFIGWHGYSLVIAVLFWGSMPRLREQTAVIVAWLPTTAVLWWSLRDSASIGWFGVEDIQAPMLLACGMALPSLAAMLWRSLRPPRQADAKVEAEFRWLLLVMFLGMLVTPAALSFTASLHPHTFDLFALRFDAAAGLGVTPALMDAVDAVPGLREVLALAYSLTPLGFLALALCQLRGRAPHLPHVLLLWVGLTCCALVAYHLFPVTGPKYVFGSGHFVAALRDAAALPLELIVVRPFARNGMPSMHFGWMLAVTVIWFQMGTRPWSRALLTFMTLCVALATLCLGEHYLIDLIVAVPFVLGAIALFTSSVPWSAAERWRTVALGFGCWLAWGLLLRTQIVFFIEHPWACWVLLAATAAVVVAQARALSRFRMLAALRAAVPVVVERTLAAARSARLTRRMGLMFFASGAAALVYQVLFAKELALVFGSTATATFTVLATFLGGMAIGSLIGGALAARVARPVVAYAFVELAIGGFCVVTPVLFAAIQGAYIFLAADMPPASPALLVLRVVLGAGVLLVPTVLMGITLPLLAQALNPRGDRLGGPVAFLYACNTAGAAVGALLTSYAVIPFLGVHSTTLVAALLNLLVALGALELAKALGATPAGSPIDRRAVHAGVPGLRANAGGRRVLAGAWLALGLGGLLSLGLEVVYVHLLSVVAGNSVYAFGLMLATFLVGLALGGECGRRLIERPGIDRAAWLAATQVALAAAVALGAWGWDTIPAYFASFADYPLVTSFGAREAVRGLVCALVMVPPTVCIGASYTLAMDLATTATARRGITMLGTSAALNTAGNIVGVLLFGFVLLPWLGGLVAGKIVAASALVVAAVVTASVATQRARWRLGAALATGVALVVVSPTRLDYELLSSGANVYFAPQKWGTVIDHAESIDGGLTTVTTAQLEDVAVKTLLTNGKFQGNDAKRGEVQAQIGFAALPLLHQGRRDSALVLGYGTGASSRVLHDAGFEHLDIADLSRDVVTMADTHFVSINANVAQQPGVQTYITDGRNLLLLTRRQYDVISIEISSIWFAGAASLYNREFYQLARAKLRPDGVLQQWVQLHHMAPTDLLTIVATLRSEFAFVSLYVVGGQGILIATNDAAHAEPLPAVVAVLDASPRLQPVRELAGRSFADIAGDRLLSPSEVDTFLDRVGLNRELWISTDNNLRLEYSTPKANANRPDRSFQDNVELMRSAQESPQQIHDVKRKMAIADTE
jgi:predicted membrane-bound spermidine synthase